MAWLAPPQDSTRSSRSKDKLDKASWLLLSNSSEDDWARDFSSIIFINLLHSRQALLAVAIDEQVDS
jgi:hypothetical protein